MNPARFGRLYGALTGPRRPAATENNRKSLSQYLMGG
nr:MAG TPA: hypothetical protein [Caudoviricetes sp.]